jgi:hypothetical protein
MRSLALSLALAASAQIVLATTPAWADPPSDAPPPAPAAATADGTVLVHIETHERGNLERRSAPGGAWEFACEAPCDKRLPVGDQYHFVGAGVNESRVFNLDGSRGDRVVLYLGGGDKQREKIGKWTVVGAGALFVAGILTIAIGSHPSHTFQADGTTNNSNFNVLAVGTSLIVVGLAGGLFGGAWWYGNSRSHVTGDVLGAPPARGSLPPAQQTGMRMPVPAAQTFEVPVLRF